MLNAKHLRSYKMPRCDIYQAYSMTNVPEMEIWKMYISFHAELEPFHFQYFISNLNSKLFVDPFNISKLLFWRKLKKKKRVEFYEICFFFI